MLTIKVKDNESIDRALKRLKRKFNDTNLVKELRTRQAFEKPSVSKRLQKKKAIYIQKLKSQEEK
jgi:small subunit ribosomal protein S21